MSYQRYPKYKESGVEWLGPVPEGWEVTSLKRVASIRYGIGEPPEYKTEGVPLVRATDLHAGHIFREALVFVEPTDIPENRIAWLRPGDIIVVRSGAYTGDSAIIPKDFGPCIGGFDMIVSCVGAYAEFVQYVFLSSYFKEGQLDLAKTRAAQPHLNAEELGSGIILLPSLSEQALIASFLDRRTGRVDTLIAEQEKLITLLQEKRQAVISHAVTKGLNPNAPMKPSGNEWLGDIPEHWKVGSLGYFASLSTGSTPNREIEEYWDGDIPWVKTGEINYSTIVATEETISEKMTCSRQAARVVPTCRPYEYRTPN